MRSPGRELQQLLGDAIPADHARQTLAESWIDRRTGFPPSSVDGRPWRVLDLGCGVGDSVDRFRARDPSVDWTGVDIADSREALERVRADARFEVFDGVSLPFADGAFELVYCKQVLEHVHRPAPLLAEVTRVLAPAGRFAGSTSQLEPFHSRSTFGYTPFGFQGLLRDAGMELLEIRPGIDAPALIARRAVGNGRAVQRIWGRWWGSRSPLNRAIDAYGALAGMHVQAVNANKLLFCGQFAFVAQRAPSPRA
jgi:SAM-dependent methyltransferase